MPDDYALLQKYKDDVAFLQKLYRDTSNVFYVQEMISLNRKIALLEGSLKYGKKDNVIRLSDDVVCDECIRR